MRTHVIEFKNVVFNDSMNLTVRLGDKWFSKVNPGDSLICVKAGTEEVVMYGTVVDVGMRRFSHLQDEMLFFEHDPECRTKSGLREVLRKAYGKTFEPDSPVTLLFFRPIPLEPEKIWQEET